MFEKHIDFSKIIVSSLWNRLQSNERSFEDLLSVIDRETMLYSIDMFQKQFCNDLIEEIEHFELSGMPVSRPNSMNKYGVILDEMGLKRTMTLLREKVCQPLFGQLYSSRAGSGALDEHHAFIVQYAREDSVSDVALKGDIDLGFHVDDAELTLNVCLGREFAGAKLYFCGWIDDEKTHNQYVRVAHEKGRALLHIGRHRHGAEPIESGERFNLIMWLRSSKVRH